MKAVWSNTKNRRTLRRTYLSILPTVRDVARKSGYAIGVHGSMTRDFDLMAMPWTKKAVSPATLAVRIEKAVCEYERGMAYHWRAVRRNTGKKPHGRIAVSIYIGTYAYIDLSIMPRLKRGVE